VERILDAATQIVMNEGVDALSIKRVADDADYTAGALYRYYPSKNALLTAVVIRVIEGLGEELAQLSRVASPDAPLAQVFAQVRRYCDFSVREQNAYALLSRMAAEPRVLIEEVEDASAIMAVTTRALLPLAGAMDAARALGLLTPGSAHERTMLLYASLQGVLQLRKQERLAPTRIDADRMATSLIHTLLRGWGASEGVLKEALEQAQILDTKARP